MGKGTDKLYITHSEWNSSDAYSASSGSKVNQDANGRAKFRRLPFNFCAASLQPFQHPVCTLDGTIFDVKVISAWIDKNGTNPVNGAPLQYKDLIKLNFARNAGVVAEGTDLDTSDMVDPVTFKVFTDNTHIVAIRHGSEANVFAWETVERLNVRAKMWNDLVDDRQFGRSDIITIQDPQNMESRNLANFKFLEEGQKILTKNQEDSKKESNVNIDALGRVGDKVLKAKEAVSRARREREAGGDINRSKTKNDLVTSETIRPLHSQKKEAYNAAQYTNGKAAASFTSTGLTPETSGERAVLTDEEYMLKPKRVKVKGYARIETNFGSMNIELYTETAPRAVWNFVQLAKKGYYSGVTFHRNVRNFMIQGGDPTGTGKGGSSIWGKNFIDEFDGPHTHDSRGVISMANKGKNTNSSQFFILYRPARHLDRKHTIFARVVDGMDVLSKLEDVPVGANNKPDRDIAIKDVVVFVDPFEEFQKSKHENNEAEKAKEALARQGGPEDEKITWTGKRVRGSDARMPIDSASPVGRYLKAAQEDQRYQDSNALSQDEISEDRDRKKIRRGGFGNFDDW